MMKIFRILKIETSHNLWKSLESTSKAVVKSLNTMKAGKSQGPYIIRPRLLKESINQIITKLD